MCKAALPSIMKRNMRSLENKVDELETQRRTNLEFLHNRLMCFTETWLQEHIPDSGISLPGFQTIRADGEMKRSEKRKGGGMNNSWCNPGPAPVKHCSYSPAKQTSHPPLTHSFPVTSQLIFHLSHGSCKPHSHHGRRSGGGGTVLIPRRCNTDAVYKRRQIRLYVLRKLRSFSVCSKMLHISQL